MNCTFSNYWWAHYAIAYLAAIGLGLLFIPSISRNLNKVFDDDVETNVTIQFHLTYSRILGLLEAIIYVSVLILTFEEFIGVWLAFKVAGRWERMKDQYQMLSDERKTLTDKKKKQLNHLKTQAIFSSFLIGNALAILYAAYAFKLFGWFKDCNFVKIGYFTVGLLVTSVAVLIYSINLKNDIKNYVEKDMPIAGGIVMRDEKHQSDMFKAGIQTGQNALKAAFLLNGGAVIALLTFIGSLINLNPRPSISLIANSILFFGWGVLVSVMGSGSTYLSQRFYYHGPNDDLYNKIGFIFNIIAILLVAASYVLFFLGIQKAQLFFLQFV